MNEIFSRLLSCYFFLRALFERFFLLLTIVAIIIAIDKRTIPIPMMTGALGSSRKLSLLTCSADDVVSLIADVIILLSAGFCVASDVTDSLLETSVSSCEESIVVLLPVLSLFSEEVVTSADVLPETVVAVVSGMLCVGRAVLVVTLGILSCIFSV